MSSTSRGSDYVRLALKGDKLDFECGLFIMFLLLGSFMFGPIKGLFYGIVDALVDSNVATVK